MSHPRQAGRSGGIVGMLGRRWAVAVLVLAAGVEDDFLRAAEAMGMVAAMIDPEQDARFAQLPERAAVEIGDQFSGSEILK